MLKSYDYQNAVRDLTDTINAVIQAEPTLISLIGTGGDPAKATKHEWLEDVMQAERDKLNGAILAADPTITVVTGSAFVAGMILAFEGYDEVMKVTAVAGNDLTVTRAYGGTIAVNMADATEVIIISRPREESTDPGDDQGRQPGTEFNYTEIFDFTAKVSGTAQAVKVYGIEDALDYQVQNGAKVLARRMNSAMIYGRRVERGTTENGSMGGLLQFIGQVGGTVVDAAGAALSATVLNDAIEEVVKKGGRPNVLVCNTNQARKISAFNNANLQVERGDVTAGTVVYRFVNDLPMGVITTIVVDPNWPKNKVGIIDTSKLRLVPLKDRAMSDKDATPNGADYYARRMLGEYTVEVKNAKEAHGLIENLQI